jgi:hypothetical protein
MVPIREFEDKVRTLCRGKTRTSNSRHIHGALLRVDVQDSGEELAVIWSVWGRLAHMLTAYE